MNEHKISENLKLFKIDASRCALRVGDRVKPETIIGEDQEDGQVLKAGAFGQVEAITFSGEDHTLVVLVREATPDPEDSDGPDGPDPVLFKIDASRSSLRVGDLVTPDTVIGEDWATADLVKAGVEGTVEAISFSGVDHALLILVRPNH